MSNESNTKLVILDITNKEHAIDTNKYLLELPDICFSDSLVLFYGKNKDKHFFFYNKNSRERVVEKADDGNISFDFSTGNVTPSKMGGEKKNDNDNDNDTEIVIDLNNFDEISNITDILYFSKEHEFKSYIYIIKKGGESNRLETRQTASADAIDTGGFEANANANVGGARIKSTGKNKAFLNTKIQMRGRQLTGGSKGQSEEIKIAILYVDDYTWSYQANNIHHDDSNDEDFKKIFVILSEKKEVNFLFILQEDKEAKDTYMIICNGSYFAKNITFTKKLNLKIDKKFLTETVVWSESIILEELIEYFFKVNIQKFNKVEEYIFKFKDTPEIKALPNKSHPFKKPIYILTYTIKKGDVAKEEEEEAIPIKYKNAASELLTLSFIKEGPDFDRQVDTIKDFYTCCEDKEEDDDERGTCTCGVPDLKDREKIFKEFKENTEIKKITETNLTSLLYKLDRNDNVYFDEAQKSIHLPGSRLTDVFWALYFLHKTT